MRQNLWKIITCYLLFIVLAACFQSNQSDTQVEITELELEESELLIEETDDSEYIADLEGDHELSTLVVTELLEHNSFELGPWTKDSDCDDNGSNGSVLIYNGINSGSTGYLARVRKSACLYQEVDASQLTGQTATLKCRVKRGTEGGGYGEMGLIFYDSAGNEISSLFKEVSQTQTSWRTKSIQKQIPNGTTIAEVSLYSEGSKNLFVNWCSLKSSNSPNELLEHNSFELGPWTKDSDCDDNGSNGSVLVYNGVNSGSTGYLAQIKKSACLYQEVGVSQLIGQTATLKCRVKRELRGGGYGEIGFTFYNSAGNEISSLFKKVAQTQTSWRTKSIQKQIPSGATIAEVSLYSEGSKSLFANWCSLSSDGSSQNNTFYASENVSDGDGSLSSPWRWSNIPDKIGNTIPYGSTIILKGEFASRIILSKQHSGISDKQRIYYDGFSSDPTFFKFSGSFNNGAIDIQGADYVTIQHFNLGGYIAKSYKKTPIGINLRGNSNGVKIENNIIHDIFAKHHSSCRNNSDSCGNAHGIHIKETNGGKIENVWVTSNRIYNLALGASEALVVNGNVKTFYIRKNTIYNVNNIGIDAIGYEENGNYYASDGWIEDNLVYKVDTRGSKEGGFLTGTPANKAYFNGKIYEESASCIYVDAGQKIRIRRNIVHHCNLGISVASEHKGINRSKAAKNIVVANNITHSSSATGLKLGSSTDDKTDLPYDGVNGCWILNNTFHQNDQAEPIGSSDTDHDGAGEIWMEHNVYNCRVVNNIILANSSRWGNVLLTNSESTASVNNNQFRNNAYYHTNSSNSNDVGCQWANYKYFKFDRCIVNTVRLGDITAVYINPQLSTEHALTSSSPLSLIDKGLESFDGKNLLTNTYLGEFDVFSGLRRINGAIDIGADEY